MSDSPSQTLSGRCYSRYPTGVCVVTVDAGGQKLGLTVGSLVSLSLDPALVDSACPAMRRCTSAPRGGRLRDLVARCGSGEWLAQHFARGVPPIAMWHGIATEERAARRCWLARSAGSSARRDEIATGTHTFFACDVRRVELGEDAPLLRTGGAYGTT